MVRTRPQGFCVTCIACFVLVSWTVAFVSEKIDLMRGEVHAFCCFCEFPDSIVNYNFYDTTSYSIFIQPQENSWNCIQKFRVFVFFFSSFSCFVCFGPLRLEEERRRRERREIGYSPGRNSGRDSWMASSGEREPGTMAGEGFALLPLSFVFVKYCRIKATVLCTVLSVCRKEEIRVWFVCSGLIDWLIGWLVRRLVGWLVD